MKNQQHTFALINTTYSAEDAREVLASLINDKIRFLNTQILSLNERFGTNADHLQARVIQLQKDRTELVKLLSAYAENDMEIEISCDVKMVVKQPITA